MARWSILFAAMLLLVSGCGDSTPASLTERGLKELRIGNYDQAIATCSQAIDQNPQDAEAFLYRGRAYQFRDAMGDSGRAVADFSEAIRLAPDVSDAYYSRAIIYRELGHTEAALADDEKARASDGHLQELYSRLPDPPPPTTVAEAQPDVPSDQASSSAPSASGDILPKSVFDQRKMYEELKERFEPGQQAAGAKESPIERYNRLSRQALEEPADEPLGPLGTFGFRAPPGSQPGQSPPSLSEDSDAFERRPARPRSSSPFQPRLSGGVSRDFDQQPQSRQTFRSVQSPFGRRVPAPTGFGVQPANPFGQQVPAAAPRQPRSSSDNKYLNPAVRPLNPRAYVP